MGFLHFLWESFLFILEVVLVLFSSWGRFGVFFFLLVYTIISTGHFGILPDREKEGSRGMVRSTCLLYAFEVMAAMRMYLFEESRFFKTNYKLTLASCLIGN